jgi:hypothetical protein
MRRETGLAPGREETRQDPVSKEQLRDMVRAARAKRDAALARIPPASITEPGVEGA